MAESNAEKLKALKLTIDKLEKSYGKGVVMKMDDKNVVPVEVISTGSFGSSGESTRFCVFCLDSGVSFGLGI